MQTEVISTPSLGNRGYLTHDGSVAIAVDVQRDYERWLQAAEEHGVTITHVFETHIHNDYVTGGFRLARLLGAEYVIPTDSDPSFSAYEMSDGDRLQVGAMEVQALHTPGHTPNHLSYVVHDGEQSAVFTGGSVLYGTVGRPDLISADMTQELASAQYDSAQRLAEELDPETSVYPTHGFGSFCSSAPGTNADSSSIASELESNIAYTSQDKQDFISAIVSGLQAYPTYYAHMAHSNQAGPGDMKILDAQELTSQQVEDMLTHDRWVLDIRDREAFAQQHPAGAVGFEYSDNVATYVGWIVPWGETIAIIGDGAEELLDTQLQLGRIGMDQFVNTVSDSLQSYLEAGSVRSYQTATFADLKQALAETEPYVLDVRQTLEHEAGNVRGSTNIPLHELNTRTQELPDDVEIWVHCESGYRASIAASLIDRAGKEVVLINDAFANVYKEGLNV